MGNWILIIEVKLIKYRAMETTKFEQARTDAQTQSKPAEFLTRRYSPIDMLLVYSFLTIRFIFGIFFRIGGFPLRNAVAFCIGTMLYYLMPRLRHYSWTNLNIAFGEKKSKAEKKRIVLGMFRHYVKTGIDSLFTEIFFPPETLADIEVDHPEYIEEALSYGRGIAGITGHLGNWELFGAAMIAKGIPVAPIFKKIANPIFDRILNDKRLTYGYDLIQVPEKKKIKVDGKIVEIEKESLSPAIKSFLYDRQGCVAFLIDQYAIGKNRVDVPIFGTPAPTQVGGVRYPQEFASPCLVSACVYEGNKLKVFVRPPVFIEPKGSAEETFTYWLTLFTAQYEEWIEQYPEQWTWGHRRYYRNNYK